MKRRVVFTKNSIPFYVAFFVYFLTKYSEYIAWSNLKISPVLDLCKNMSYLLCFLIIIFNIKLYSHIKLFSMIIICIVGVATVYQVFFNDEKSLFVVLLFSAAFMGNDFIKFLKLNLGLHISCFLLTLCMSLCGLAENVIKEQEKFGDIWSRMSLGFNYPGQPMMFMMPIVFLFYYIYEKRINIFYFLLSILCVLSVYVFSQTIMPTLICIGYIVVVSCFRNIAKWKRIYWLIPLAAGVTFLVLFMHNKGMGIADKIDRISNYRFSLGLTAIQQYGIFWFGTGFKNINTKEQYLIVDSEYIYMLVSNGILYLVLAVALFTVFTKWAVDKKDLLLVWICLFLALHAVFNNGIYNLLMNPFIVMLCPILWGLCSKVKLSTKIKIRRIWKINRDVKNE